MTRIPGPLRLLSGPKAILSSALLVAALLSLTTQIAAASTPVAAGFRDYDFGTSANSTPTGEKPESKLWWNDGFWWGVLWSPSSSAYTIHRFNLAAQDWVDTGTPIDLRTSAKSDVLWDGQRLYIVSHVFSLVGGPGAGANSGQLYRYSYNASTDTYALDSGFPVSVNSSKSETLVLDKDTTGKLWVTWVEGGKVMVNRSTGDDLTWGTPFALSVAGAANLNSDDISSVVKFGGSKIGIMWSNQTDAKMYFSVHLDGSADVSWQPSEDASASIGTGMVADDHISLKASCAADGAVYAAMKTGLGTGKPLVLVLKRTSSGTWSSHVAGMYEDNHTRPILEIDADANRAYVFSMSDQTGRYVIYQKSASLTDMQFSGGLGTAFIDSPTDLKNNNPSSTKQCVNGATGLLVMSSDQDTHYYLHNYLDLSGTSPTISSFTPGSAVVGTEVTINGARFTGATSVTFNGTAATSFTVDNSTRIRANVPTGATTGPIRVTTPSGTGISATSFTVIVPPTVTAFSPSSGPAGAQVSVSGTGFATTSAVRFNGTTASFTINSDTQLNATVPGGATSGPIIVTTSTGSDTSDASFTVIQPPTITAFNPTSGPGSSEVTVDGTGFSTATGVKFGAIAATFTIDSPTRLRATVPGGFVSGPISVSNPAGTGTSSGSFTVTGPVITGFSPGSAMSGAQVTIDGSGFASATAVAFNGASASFVIDSNVRLRAIVPTAATTGRIAVTTPDGTAQSAANFIAIVPPTITSFTPDRGPVGTNVTIAGRDFYGVTGITFNGTTATVYTVDSDSIMHATVPATAGSGRIAVTTTGGTAQSAANFLVIGPPPTLTFTVVHDAQVNSSNTSTNYGSDTSLRVRGSNSPFYNSYLKFNLVNVGPAVRKATLKVYCNDESPDGGAVYLVSNNYLGTSTPWVESGITYSNAPAISGSPVAPSQNAAINTWVEYNVTSAITGDGTISFGMKSANTNSAYYDSKEGAHDPVLVIESQGAPGISSFTPVQGQVGTSVTVNGTGFTGATSVKFNGVSATFTVNNDSTLVATAPSGSGSGPISVTTSVGTAVSAANFTLIVAPVISSFTPASGAIGTEITVQGTGFTTTSTVKLNGTPTFFTIDNDSQLRFVVQGGATSGPITVINVVGTVTSAGSFQVIKPPTLTFFNPSSGPAGIEVQVHGANFTAISAVKFNGTTAGFTVDSDTLLRATVPAGASSGPISVSNPAGTATSTSNFTVVITPAITSFSPASGPVGTQVAVRGVNFIAITSVKFNGTSASFTVDSDTLLHAGVPSGAESGPITVTNPGGLATSATNFIVLAPPTIVSYNPTSGPMGTVVTIQGTAFGSVTSFKFNGTPASFIIDSDTQMRATVPVGATSGLLSVTNPIGTYTTATSFTVFPPPNIVAFSPVSGPVGAAVTVQGNHFLGASAVKFNATAASFTIDNDNQLRTNVPGGATTGPITVTTPNGIATSSENFTVVVPPTITTFSPTRGEVGAEVTIQGSSFGFATLVKFNGVSASFTIDGDNQIRATVPAGANSGPISVTNPAGTFTSSASFTIIPPPTISFFTPTTGPAGTDVTVHGTGFTFVAEVKFNGVLANFTINNDTQLHAMVPSGATTGPVSVTNPAGTATSGSDFIVILSPAVTDFDPPYGPVGTVVTVDGANFTTVSSVRFNGAAAVFSIDSDTQLHATVPLTATSGPISVTNVSGSAASANDFYVVRPPTISSFTPTSGPVGTVVTINGTNLGGTSAVRFNGLAGSFTVVSDTELHATVPAGATTGPISVTNSLGTFTTGSSFTVTNQVAVDDRGIPMEFALGHGYPNPFSAQTRIDFELPRSAKVRLVIYDLAGRSVRTLVDEDRAAGVHQATWDGRDRLGSLVSTGIYMLRFEAGGFAATRRLLRLR